MVAEIDNEVVAMSKTSQNKEVSLVTIGSVTILRASKSCRLGLLLVLFFKGEETNATGEAGMEGDSEEEGAVVEEDPEMPPVMTRGVVIFLENG